MLVTSAALQWYSRVPWEVGGGGGGGVQGARTEEGPRCSQNPTSPIWVVLKIMDPSWL